MLLDWNKNSSFRCYYFCCVPWTSCWCLCLQLCMCLKINIFLT